MPCGLRCANVDVRKTRSAFFTSTKTEFATTDSPKLALNGKPCVVFYSHYIFLCHVRNFAGFFKRKLEQYIAYVVKTKENYFKEGKTVPLQFYEMLCSS